jgi:hypothetical protein
VDDLGSDPQLALEHDLLPGADRPVPRVRRGVPAEAEPPQLVADLVGPGRPGPREWLPGDSGTPWFLGLFVLCVLAGFAGSALSALLFPLSGRPGWIALLPQLALSLLIGLPIVVLYVLFVPRPMGVVASPGGIENDFGLRRKQYAWRDLHFRALDVFLFGDLGGLPGRIAPNRHQRDRLEAWRRAYFPT